MQCFPGVTLCDVRETVNDKENKGSSFTLMKTSFLSSRKSFLITATVVGGEFILEMGVRRAKRNLLLLKRKWTKLSNRRAALRLPDTAGEQVGSFKSCRFLVL